MLMEKMKEGSCAIQPVFGYGGGGGLNILQLFQELISPVNDIDLPDLPEVPENQAFVPEFEGFLPEMQGIPPEPPLQEDPFLDPPPSTPPPQQHIFSLNAVPVPLTSSPTSFIYFTDTGTAMSWEIVDESQINNQNHLADLEIILPIPIVHNNDSGLPDSPVPPGQN